MSTNYDSRLQNLKQRRQGSTQEQLAKAVVALDSIYGRTLQESYEKRSAKKATRYALGALQEVDPEYTKNSYTQGDRVKNQLAKGLQGEIQITFEYQGSVPLNVHIRGISDIDLLVLHANYLTVDTYGAKNQRGGYVDWSGDSGPLLLTRMRSRSASVLRLAFPEVNVAVGDKSIALSGGSLTRKVDVVPSHWHDSADYQLSGQIKDRAVCILDASVNTIIKNFPFLHMHYINVKDSLSVGGTKKMIRLLKTLKADSDYSNFISLNSYDIASLVWHFQTHSLIVQRWSELSLVAVAKEELTNLVGDKARVMQLKTPDGTRCIINSEEKFTALVFLYSEVIELSESIAKEVLGSVDAVSNDRILRALKTAVVA